MLGLVGVLLVGVLLVGVLLVGVVPGAHAVPVRSPVVPIAARYAADGPDAVVHEVVRDAVGRDVYEVFAPRDLGPAGTRHAVITWGNGSFAHPTDYAPFLRHLATWGFVVVAASTDQSGTGEEILAATRTFLTRDGDPRSRYHGHLRTDHVGAGGHSQGAGGTVRAALGSHGLVSAVVLADLPNPLFAFPRSKAYDVRQLRVPTFLVAGADDTLISSAALNRSFLDSIPGPAAMGLLQGADHNTVQHDAGGYRGDLTAWFRWLLLDDPVAAAVFTGPRPELLRDPAWQDQALRLQPAGPPTG